MAFVRVLNEEEFQAETFRSGNSWSIVVNVGYDDEKPISYSLHVGLSPMAGGPIEFYFQIVEFDEEYESEHAFLSGKDTACFLKGDDRKIVLWAVLTAAHMLLEAAKPERVEYVAYDPDPPEKALLKHWLIGKVFEESGYEVSTADPFHGKRVWWMVRQK
jgi:hypothetical protein